MEQIFPIHNKLTKKKKDAEQRETERRRREEECRMLPWQHIWSHTNKKQMVTSSRGNMIHWGQWCMLLLCGPLLMATTAERKAVSMAQLLICIKAKRV